MLGYRLNTDGRGLSQLTCKNHWKAALAHTTEKYVIARTHAMVMEVKNLMSGESPDK